MEEEEVHIRVFIHSGSGLVMAMSDDLPGFIVHANSKEELQAKLSPAYVSFMKAMGREVEEVVVERIDAPPGFEPPAFIARAHLARAA